MNAAQGSEVVAPTAAPPQTSAEQVLIVQGLEHTIASGDTQTILAPVETASKPTRIIALDFTKGALVLIMVLYHWLNYFVGPEGFIYRYLRFLPPSFIFITGFLISQVYLSRSRLTSPQLARRLTVRGLKILAVFICLNLIKALAVPDARDATPLVEYLAPRTIMAIYVTGTSGAGKVAAFYVLVPIAYLLIVSACFILLRKRFKYVFQVICGVAFLCTMILEYNGVTSANLELLTIGLVGLSCGYIGIDRINSLSRFTYILVAIYLFYIGIITIWEVSYPVQVLGVCCTLILIYILTPVFDKLGKVQRSIVLLGQYSLLGYIAQIAVVQLLYRGLRHVPLWPGVLGLSFLAACVLTMTSVVTVDRARAKARTVDVVYKAIFA